MVYDQMLKQYSKKKKKILTIILVKIIEPKDIAIYLSSS